MLLESTTHILAAGEQKLVASDGSDSIDISLLTCQPHDEIYSLYGHTAIRVQNYTRGYDWTVNFGVFDSTESNFVLKFIFGLTDYMMGIYKFSDFLKEYEFYGSAVYQQHLNLSTEEKEAFMKAMQINAQPENLVYRYNFFYNNCTTRARDMILTAKEGEVEYKPVTHLQRDRMTFRELIHLYNADHPWARFGNDLLLGIGSDLNTDEAERQFLPEVLSEDFDSTTVIALDGSRHALVDTASWVLLAGKPFHPEKSTVENVIDSLSLTPTLCAIIFLCVVLALCMAERFLTRRRLPWMHLTLSLPYGITGIILTAMIFSQHPTVSLNLQILIANPLITWFAFPKMRWHYRWHAVLGLCIIFCIGNVIQSYAEGMNIMAVTLAIIAAENIIPIPLRTTSKG